jgi:hypothetical protein
MRLVYALLVAGAALSNSTAETVLASRSLPAGSLQVGKVYRLRAAVLVTAQNSTDTLAVKIRVGPTTLTGTVVGSSAAFDAVVGDVVTVDLEMVVRNIGSASIVIVSGIVSAEGAEAVATARVAFESLSLDSTVAQLVEVTGTWSVASASNSCRCDAFTLTELV